TGDSSTKDAKSYKSKRKNAKIENDKLCFNTVTDDEKKCTNKENSARGVCKLVAKSVKTLERKE
ncbi:TPA: recombinase family protein, partial [Streptococcus pneumoniae]